MIGVRLYLAQRISALVMIPLVFAHLGLMIYAIQGGLSSAEILSRTQGSLWWAMFYGLFVVAASLHAAIGLRVIISETFGIGKFTLNILTLAIGFVLMIIGLKAVWAVIA